MKRKKQGRVVRAEEGSISGRTFLFVLLGAVLFGALLFFVLPLVNGATYESDRAREARLSVEGKVQTSTTTASEGATTSPQKILSSIPAYQKTPSALKGIYMTQCVVGTPSFRAKLVTLIEETELNAVVIDIKDYSGKIAITTDNPALKASVSDACGARDMQAFIAELHAKHIYVIGRITVFQDPFYSSIHPELAVKFKNPAGAVWKDNKGLSFIDVGAKPYWEYIVTLSREAHRIGFDELNYDYVRFPSDGPMSNISYDWAKERPKAEVLEDFFSYLHDEMKRIDMYPEGTPAPVISADLFGMTTTASDDMNIGQVWERALPHFDYLAPMVYPSHYPAHFNNWNNPNTVPYELIHFVLNRAIERAEATSTSIFFTGAKQIFKEEIVSATKTTATTTRSVFSGLYEKPAYDKQMIRPWLQDFKYGGNYGPKEVRAQIQATEDLGLTSWVLWAPSNVYTREALK